MDAIFKQKLATRLADWSHLSLVGHLLMLHVLAFGGWKSPTLSLLWVAAIGLFLIWQPFVAGERRISERQVVMLFLVVLGSLWILGPWLLLVWCGALAAAIGGRVMWTERRGERTGYLLAFSYVVCITIFGVLPELSPRVVLDPLPREAFALLKPLLLPLLLIFPARAPQRRAGESFDLFYGMLVFLVLAVFVLGALAYMLVGGVGYVQALFMTSLTMAGALLLVAWSWNPRGGFSGVSSAVSRYLLSVGMPLEQWLLYLSEENERQAEPKAFVAAVMVRLLALPWVVGVSWETDDGGGQSGERSAHMHEHRGEALALTVYFRLSPSPSMHWHLDWLLRLSAEFYQVKRQALELQRMSYLQAVYETGSRVTHDVKNLLQSLQGLCYAAAQPGDPAQLAGLLGKQLPLITERLKATLEKLQTPPLAERGELMAADAWWQRLRSRYADSGIDWQGEPDGAARVPSGLFDSVTENLLQNALAKRLRQPGLNISVHFADGVLTVSDDGEALTAELSGSILRQPVNSLDGLGIGLYHAARQAQAAGYRLELSDNQPRRVAFRLSPSG